jgi:hypothetical protein
MTLSETLHSAVDGHVDLDLDLSAIHRRADRRRRRRARARAAGGAFGAAVVLVGLVALAAGAGDQRPDVMAQQGEVPIDEPTTTSAPPSSSDPAPSTESTTTTSTTTEPAPSTESTTTTTEPAPTTEAPPTTTAPPPAAVVSWTYAGTERWRLSQPQCAQLTHWLDAEATGSDGSTWTMREDYCGVNDGDRWEGEGTFSLTGAAGSLTGLMTSSAPMPTTGVPYTWTVEGGTGAYDGASGECVVTITMTDAVFGSARHEGTITCDLALPGDGASGSVPESA